MSHIDSIIFVLAGLSGIALIFYGLLSPDAKEARRRRRNHGRVVARANRPMVKFSARTK